MQHGDGKGIGPRAASPAANALFHQRPIAAYAGCAPVDAMVAECTQLLSEVARRHG